MSKATQALENLKAQGVITPCSVTTVEMKIISIDDDVDIEATYNQGSKEPEAVILRHESGDGYELSRSEIEALRQKMNGVI